MNDESRPGEDAPERTTLETWGAGWTAPPELRGATLAAARERGLVKGDLMSRRGFWMGAVAAAAAVMFVAGFGLGSRQAAPAKGGAMTSTQTATAPAAAAAYTGPRFALFLFEDAGYQAAPEGRMMDRVREYGGWARSLAEAGRFVDGEKLADDGRFCRLEGGALTAAGPRSDPGRGVLAGYFLIGAANLDEAMEVAKSCPHLKYGGTLEIRQLETS